EAANSLRSESWNAAAAMARRAVQAATRDLGAAHGSLYEEVKELGAKGLLTTSLVDWALHVKAIGNVGAHPDPVDGDVTANEARDAVSFAEYFLIYSYSVPADIARKRGQKK
ncbi:MAG: hypothetical protein JWM82_2834, partial [Myxococcales bacterium]|nr:hypothetical protein [Myxococcales bacterium]